MKVHDFWCVYPEVAFEIITTVLSGNNNAISLITPKRSRHNLQHLHNCQLLFIGFPHINTLYHSALIKWTAPSGVVMDDFYFHFGQFVTAINFPRWWTKSGQLMPSMGHAITWTIYVNQRYHKYGDTCPRYIVHSRLRAMFYLLLNSNRTLANELISIRNQASYEAIIQTNVSQEPGPKFNTNMLYRHMNYHCIDNTK